MSKAAAWIEAMHAKGVTLGLRNGRLYLFPSRVYKELTHEERETLRQHRAEIRALVRAAGPLVQAQPTAALAPEPIVYVTTQSGRRHRLTEEDVREAMLDLGDDTLRDYEAGRISKAEAYEMTRCGYR